MIHIDLSRPVLNWTHPQQAMKQNMNVLIGMGFGLIVFAALAIPAAALYSAGLNTFIMGLIITAEAVAADILLLPRVLNYAEKRYIEIMP
jgi:ABC-2 type transport system permease protein